MPNADGSETREEELYRTGKFFLQCRNSDIDEWYNVGPKLPIIGRAAAEKALERYKASILLYDEPLYRKSDYRVATAERAAGGREVWNAVKKWAKRHGIPLPKLHTPDEL